MFVKEWKKKCLKAKEDFENWGDNDGFYEEHWTEYRTTIEHWWCGCPSFHTSANHVCKHLIAMYIGRQGLESNKPPMPFYGEVWRQTVNPPLWIAKLHPPEKLKVRDLQPVSEDELPILDENHIPNAIPDDDLTPDIDDHGLEVEPALYDSDDDSDNEEEKNHARDRMEHGQNDDNAIGDDDEDWEDIGGFGDVFDDDDFEDEESAEDRMERQLRGDEIKENADLFERQLRRIVEELQEVQKYPSGHRFLSELPRMGIDNVPAWHRLTEHRDIIKRGRVIRPTFDRVRSGNMFANG